MNPKTFRGTSKTSRGTTWLQLKGRIAEEVFAAPKTVGDLLKKGDWPRAYERSLYYLVVNVLDKPWANHLALLAAVMIGQRRDAQTVSQSLSALNHGFTHIFPALNLKTMDDWEPEKHIAVYLKGEILADHSLQKRAVFWSKYSSAMKHSRRWLQSLSAEEQDRYKTLIIPEANPERIRGLINWQEVIAQQRRGRKSATDALLPQYADLRAEAHHRYAILSRLRQAYRDALMKLKGDSLPFDFSYEEHAGPDEESPTRERLHFKIWDRRSFVLAHKEQYGEQTVKEAERRATSFKLEKEHFFLEFVKAERLIGDAPPEGFWFEELIKLRVLGAVIYSGSPEEIKEKQRLVRGWGYGTDDHAKKLAPFKAVDEGVLIVPPERAYFLHRAQAKTGCVFIPVEEFYTAATFGLLAIDIFTTTGMRINELCQIRIDNEHLVRLEMPAPPEAKDKTLRVRYALRLVPKGERANKLHTYFVSKETIRIMTRVGRLLEEHYGLNLTKGEKLPIVNFTKNSSRTHRFWRGPYLLQHNHHHLSPITITGCMRFLLHGMIFKTADSKLVVITPHLLRHAFATYAVHVAKVPIDIVAAMLKHKKIEVTDYYSQPTEFIVSEAANEFFYSIAGHVSVGDEVVRMPEELQQLVEDAQGKYGTLSNVIGGECVVPHDCVGKFACIGCAGHVPDPAKRHQVEQKKEWAMGQVKMAAEEGLTLEAEKMRQLSRRCEVTLKEMDQIEAYRKDEDRAALIQIEPRRRK